MTYWREPTRPTEKYGVYFNRDELKTRPRAHPPELREGGFLSPLDPKGGGTWMTVNRHGVIVALLNHWHLEENAKGSQSRGKLVWNLSEENDVVAVEKKLLSLKLSDYSPFILMLMDQEDTKRWEWNGKDLTQGSPTNPNCSSSFDYENVRSAREKSYSKLESNAPLTALEPIDLEHFHTEAPHSAYSVRMLRPDAQTWSRSIITIDKKNIDWLYHEEFPDLKKPAKVWTSQLK